MNDGKRWTVAPRSRLAVTDEITEALARIIDPEAFGLPAWRPSDGSDYLTDRDEARDKARVILARLGQVDE